MNSSKTIIFIVGPTAVGKTDAALHFSQEINATAQEYLDWKDVYAHKVPKGRVGVVIFAVNKKNDVFIEWRFESETVKIGSKTTFNDKSANGLTAEVEWIDR